MFRTTLAAAALAVLTLAPTMAAEGPAVANDPVSLRQHAMAVLGQATGIGGRMLKGEIEYNAQAGRAVLLTMNAVALGYGRMFPEDAKSPAAKDTIWTDRDGFRAAVAKFIADAEKAAATPVGDIDAFRAQFGAVTANCGSCHEAYRVKTN